MLPLEQLAGHGKNPHAIQKSLPLEQCLTISTYSQELEDLPEQPNKLVELKQPNLSKLTSMPKPSSDRTIQVSQSTQTYETFTDRPVLELLRQDSHAQAPALPAQERDSITNILDFGLKQCELLESADPNLSSSKIPQGYSVVEWMESFGNFPKAGMMRSGRLSQLQHLKLPTVAKGFLSLPTPNASSGATSRPAGQTKCETWFRSNRLLADSQCLSPQIVAQLLGFPKDWTRCLWELKEDRPAELEADICSVEPLCQRVPRSPLEELNILIPASSEAEKLPLERGFKIGDRVCGFFYKGVILSSFDLEWFHVAWDGQDNKLAAPYHITDLKHELPLEHEVSEEDSRSIELYDRLADLESKRDFIRGSGPVAQIGVWIEYGKISKRKFRQAYYRSTKPIFQPKRQCNLAKSESGLVKRCYIGEENSKEVKAAGEAIARRNELERIGKEIKLIENKL
jgi:hypothetical protein